METLHNLPVIKVLENRLNDNYNDKIDKSIEYWLSFISKKINEFSTIGNIGSIFTFQTFLITGYEETLNFKQRISRLGKVKDILEKQYGEKIIINIEKNFYYGRYLDMKIQF